jgi:uncharacterized membrane protein
MGKGRLEAFSDGVIAVIITIMVLEMKVPHGADLAALEGVTPVFLSYLLSFIYIGIYWNNHHHMLQTVKHVTGGILWANLHLLFWLSLVPFTTGWMGENHFRSVPMALYGFMLMMAGAAYSVLQQTIIAAHGGKKSALFGAVGHDLKGKLSLVAYATAIILSFVVPTLAGVVYVAVALMWLVPDRRIEAKLGS